MSEGDIARAVQWANNYTRRHRIVDVADAVQSGEARLIDITNWTDEEVAEFIERRRD